MLVVFVLFVVAVQPPDGNDSMGPSPAGRPDEFSIRVQRRPLLGLPDGAQVAPRPKVPQLYVF